MNKLIAVVLILVGVVPMVVDGDATAFVLFLVIGVGVFFSKENSTYRKHVHTPNNKIL